MPSELLAYANMTMSPNTAQPSTFTGILTIFLSCTVSCSFYSSLSQRALSITLTFQSVMPFSETLKLETQMPILTLLPSMKIMYLLKLVYIMLLPENIRRAISFLIFKKLLHNHILFLFAIFLLYYVVRNQRRKPN